jgi:uncharacterized protein
MFRIQLAELASGHSQLQFQGQPIDFGLDPEIWPEPVQLAVEVDRRDDRLTLQGQLATTTNEQCSRCLGSYRANLESELVALANRLRPGISDDESNVDDYILYHDGRVLELDETVREQLLLARPMTGLCRPDCAGLCPGCGEDLNRSSCRCETEKRETPPAAGQSSV